MKGGRGRFQGGVYIEEIWDTQICCRLGLGEMSRCQERGGAGVECFARGQRLAVRGQCSESQASMGIGVFHRLLFERVLQTQRFSEVFPRGQGHPVIQSMVSSFFLNCSTLIGVKQTKRANMKRVRHGVHAWSWKQFEKQQR